MIARALVSLILAAGVLVPGTVSGQEAAIDSARVSGIVEAESTIDSLRADIRRLDRLIQSMKMDLADRGGVEELLQALAGEPDANVPEDTRSRRQRVDAFLKAITQRPGQLRFNGGTTAIAQRIVSGGADDAAGSSSLDIYAHTSFGPRTLLFFDFEAGWGAGLDAALPLDSPVNGDAAPTRSGDGFDRVVLREAWAEFNALDNTLLLTAGKIDLTNYFDINHVANDETAQFLSGAFVNSAALAAPGVGPGARARTVLFRRISLQGGATSADSTGGTRFEKVFVIGGLGVLLFPNSTHDGNIRAYAYSPTREGGSAGWGVSLDQEIASAWTLFGRYGRNNDAMVSRGALRSAWSAGAQFEVMAREHQMVFAAAYGETRDSRKTSERMFETYASWQVNTWTFVSPHVQLVRNLERMSRPSTVVGLRVQFNF